MQNHQHRIPLVGLVGLGLLVGISGCVGAAMGGARMVGNMMKDKNYLRVSLDGKEGKQKAFKKALAGHSEWKIKDSVSTAPTLRYRMLKPERFGRITFTTISIYQEFRGKYSSQPEFTISSQDSRPEHLIQADENYDLGNLPAWLKVTDVRGDPVDGVTLIPGMKYQLQLTVKADRSETANVYFETD